MTHEKPLVMDFFPDMKRKGVNRFQDYLDAIRYDEKITIPQLKRLGFKISWTQGEEVYTRIPRSQIKRFSSWDMRLLLGGAGKLANVYLPKQRNKAVLVNIKTIASIKPGLTKNYPIYNLPGKWVEGHEALPKLELINLAQDMLGALNIYYLIFTATKNYWFGRYVDIPQEQLLLGFKNKSKRPDRLITKAGYSEGMFHPMEDGLQEQILHAINHI